MIRKLSHITKSSCSDRLVLFTDGNDDYVSVLPKHYPPGLIDYGQLIKIREKGRLVRKVRRVVYGDVLLDEIETTDVENFNGILRERLGRLVRKTKCFTKNRKRLTCAVSLFQFYWNFINKFKRNASPAKIEGLTDHVWTWHELFHFKISILN